MDEISQIYGISRMAVSKRLKSCTKSWEALSHDRASQLFVKNFCSLVYKRALSVLIGERQIFRLGWPQS